MKQLIDMDNPFNRNARERLMQQFNCTEAEAIEIMNQNNHSYGLLNQEVEDLENE